MEPVVSATEPDWSRESKRFFEWAPSRSLLASIRAYQRHARQRGLFHKLLKRWAVARHRFWTIVTGAEIPINTRIAGGLLIPHPNGIVVHPNVVVGPNCLVFQQVTLGANNSGVPIIGGHVDIGAGAKVLGPITVGSNVQIGANAVVVSNLPDGVTAVGIPAHWK